MSCCKCGSKDTFQFIYAVEKSLCKKCYKKWEKHLDGDYRYSLLQRRNDWKEQFIRIWNKFVITREVVVFT